jgi:hypothetical protein
LHIVRAKTSVRLSPKTTMPEKLGTVTGEKETSSRVTLTTVGSLRASPAPSPAPSPNIPAVDVVSEIVNCGKNGSESVGRHAISER